MSLIADVFDVSLIDASGNIYASTTLSSADIDIRCDSKEIRAGRGDALISILRSNRQVDIRLAEVTFKWDFIKLQLGTTGTTASTVARATSKWYECVDLDGEGTGTAIGFSLDEKPLASSSGLKIFSSAGTEVKAASGYTISDKTVTIVDGVIGDRYEVRGYKYNTAATAETVLIDNISFPDDVICVLETLEVSEEGETPLSRIQYIFDKAVPDGNLTISTKKEKDASVTNFNLKALKPTNSNNIGRVIKIPVS